MSDELEFIEDLADIIESLSPSDYVTTMDRDRPYGGQQPERAATEIKGITFRDLRDACVGACFESSGLPPSEWPTSLYDLPWDSMDPMAIFQNIGCEVERMMGIYPNVIPPLGVEEDS